MSREADPVARDPSSYRFWHDNRVRFQDLDLLGHVNNVAFIVYAEDARAAFFTQTGLWKIGSPRSMVLAHLSIDFLSELRYPADIRAGVRVLDVGRRSIHLGVAIFEGERCVASSRAVAVRWHADERRAIELDEADRGVLLGYWGGG